MLDYSQIPAVAMEAAGDYPALHGGNPEQELHRDLLVWRTRPYAVENVPGHLPLLAYDAYSQFT